MNAQLSMLNRHPETKVPYGYIAANALDQEVVNELLCNHTALNHTEMELVVDFATNEGFEPTGDLKEDYHQAMDYIEDNYVGDWDNDVSLPEEPIITGEYEGVKYQTSWLGGALNFWIFESPVTTNKGRKASPCVPGACILDALDGDEYGYDVPADWRADHE